MSGKCSNAIWLVLGVHTAADRLVIIALASPGRPIGAFRGAQSVRDGPVLAMFPQSAPEIKCRSTICAFWWFHDPGGRQGRDRASLAVPSDAPGRRTCSTMLSGAGAALGLNLFTAAHVAE